VIGARFSCPRGIPRVDYGTVGFIDLGDSPSRSALVGALLSVTLLTSGGCGLFRGIPTHGGGKRFDEEQRAVASAIRRTLADMDLGELEARRVQIVIECMAQDGGGTVIFPGLTNISGGVSGNVGEGNFLQIVPVVPQGSRTQSENENWGIGGHMSGSYNTNMTYSPAAMGSSADAAYLHAALEMKARHVGVQLVAAEPEVVLYVLVDVLGTNRSHVNHIVNTTETLVASCECTYYAMDAKTGQLVFRARRASSASTYREYRAWFVDGADVQRATQRTPPTSMPVDEDYKPSTQPAVARDKKRAGFGLARTE
jgi:hypothetical protein